MSYIIVSSGVVSNGITLSSSGDLMTILGGGTANSTTVNNRGYLYVSSGGTANNTKVISGGMMCVSSGGTALVIKENGGHVKVESGAQVTFVANTFSGLILESREAPTLHSGTVAVSTTLCNANMYIESGGRASHTTVYHNGDLIVSSHGTANDTFATGSDAYVVISGGTANRTVVKNCATMYISGANGVANSTTVKNTAQLYVHSGGTANSTTVSDWAAMYVFRGGSAHVIDVKSCGELHVARGGTVTTVRENGGYVEVLDGANVTFAANAFSNLMLSSGSATIHSGTVANSTTAQNASLAVFSGGVVNATKLKQSGELLVAHGGTASNTTLTSGGSLAVSSGGLVTGALTIHQAAAVVMDSGAVFDFDLTTRTPASATIVNDLSLVKGDPTYTISIANAQAGGVYKLAEGAQGFNKSITITKQSGATATVSVNSTVSVGGTSCTLNLNNTGLLSLTVGAGTSDPTDTTPPAAPTVKASTTAATNKAVTLTATFSSDTATKQYSTDNKTWKTYSSAISVSVNGTYYFRAIDAAGNISKVTSYKVSNITVSGDTTPPVAPTVKASTTAATNKAVTLTATFSSDTATKQYSTDNKTWKSYTAAILVKANGTYYFRAIDAAGNISKVTTYKVSNITDMTAPSGLSAQAKKYNVTLAWAKAAAPKGVKVSYQVKVDGVLQPKAVTSVKFSLKNASVGKHDLAVRMVRTQTGGKVEYSPWNTTSLTVADITAPTLGAVSGSVNGYTATVKFAATDNVAVKYYMVTMDGVAKKFTGSSASFKNLAIGKHTASVQAVDAAGNASKAKKVTLTVKDATAPGKVSKFNAVSMDKGKATLSWNAVSDNSNLPVSYEVELSTGKIIKAKTNSCSVKLAAGSYTYRVRAVDKAKNVGAWSTAQKFSIATAAKSAAIALSFCDTLRLDSALQAAADASSLTANAVKEQAYLAAL